MSINQEEALKIRQLIAEKKPELSETINSLDAPDLGVLKSRAAANEFLVNRARTEYAINLKKKLEHGNLDPQDKHELISNSIKKHINDQLNTGGLVKEESGKLHMTESYKKLGVKEVDVSMDCICHADKKTE